jgi:hypothetical protein
MGLRDMMARAAAYVTGAATLASVPSVNQAVIDTGSRAYLDQQAALADLIATLEPRVEGYRKIAAADGVQGRQMLVDDPLLRDWIAVTRR